jgi:triacylglycerol lipase
MRGVLFLLVLLSSAASAQVPPARDPILFVHGWRGDHTQWLPMMQRFRADGWTDRELFAWDFVGRGSNAGYAVVVAARVDQILAATGASHVVIVSHSMGSLSTRYYLRNMGGAEKVSAWVSLAGPNHGTSTAELCFFGACSEMRRGSAFLAALNEHDETPGGTRYATWRSPCDELIDPVETVSLEGAENHETSCLLHLDVLGNYTVYQEVRDFVMKREVVVRR